MTLNKDCPLCKGRGWYEGPSHDPNFGWQVGPTPCLDCNPVDPPTKLEIAALILMLLMLVTLPFWGGR